MASQTKITGFYRPTKANSSAAAAKKRKAVIEDPVSEVKFNCDIKPAIVTLKQETIVNFVAEPDVLKSDQLKKEPAPTGNSKNIFTDGIEHEKTVQKKPCMRKSRKTLKSEESSMKVYFSKNLSEKAFTETEIIKRETTSFADNHGSFPAEVSTPKGATSLSTSCRKRKMQCIDEQSEVVRTTPEKPAEKSTEIQLPTRVRKKLEMGTEKVAANQAIEEVNSKADLLASPSKPVTFLCMGTLSPRKPAINSPIRAKGSPLLNTRTLQSSSEKTRQNLAEKRFKSPAVKSLASLLDKAAPPEKVFVFVPFFRSFVLLLYFCVVFN